MANNKEEIYRGIPASPGIVIGHTRSLLQQAEDILAEPITDVEVEIRLFREALAYIKKYLNKIASDVLRRLGAEFARIFEAQMMIMGDEVWNKNVEQRIAAERLCAEYIYNEEAQKVIVSLSQSREAYLKERIQDIQAVTSRLVAFMRGEKRAGLGEFDGATVVVARYLSPGDILTLSLRKNLAFATGVGGPTSHAALMAKSLSVPAVIGLGGAAEKIASGNKVIIDGYEGLLILNPSAKTISNYRQAKRDELQLKHQLAKLKSESAITKDKRRVEILANIELPIETAKVRSAGSQGIGLFRTEYLFLTRSDFPTFEEQYEAYACTLKKMGNLPVVIRTFDLGGDKFPEAVGRYFETNPFLGWRAIRFCLDRPELFKVQLKALLKASSRGNLRILIPMISNLDEVLATKKLLEECRQELRAEKVKFVQKIPLGVMLEVPSAVMIADHIAREVDFFSIGTNDLIQYTLAVDRDHELISKLYQSFHPAIIHLIKEAVISAHKHHKKISVCGEMAADPLAAVLLIGLGIDELSSGFQATGILKKVVRSITYSGAKRIADKALQMKQHGEIETFLNSEVARTFPEILPVIQFSRRNSNG